MMQYQYQLVLEFYHYKLSTTLLPKESISKKIVVHMEGFYRNKVIKSTEYQLKNGTQLAIPWSERLDQFRVNYFYIDDQLKMELGHSEFHIPNERGFSFDEPNRIAMNILPNGGLNRIGKVMCLLSVEKFYADEDNAKKIEKNPPVKNMLFHVDSVVPGFRFRRLAKAVNWNKIRMIDIDRVIEMNDVNTILTCVDDVALGDAAEEDCDPRLLRALHIAQFSAQYLLSSKKLMDEKKKTITKALHVFDEEESVLDLKLAKYRARRKAMMREMAEMDRVSESYRRTLIALKPKLKNKKLEELLKESSSEDDEAFLASRGLKKKKHHHKSRKDKNRYDDNEDQYEEIIQDPNYYSQKSHRSTKGHAPPADDLSTDSSQLQFTDKKIEGNRLLQAKIPSNQPVPSAQGSSKDWKSAKASSVYQSESTQLAQSVPPPNLFSHLLNNNNNNNNENAENRNMVMLEAEYDPNSKVKTFTSYKPVVVNRRSTTNQLFANLNDDEDEQPPEDVRRSRQEDIVDRNPAANQPPQGTARVVESRPPMKEPVVVQSKPVQTQKQSPPQYEQNQIFDATSASDGNFDNTTSSFPTMQSNKLQNNTEMLMDFARKRREMSMTQDSTLRSSVGAESNAMSVDSLNGPVGNNNNYPQGMSRNNSNSNRNSFNANNLNNKTWTPTNSASPAFFNIQDPPLDEDDARPEIPLAKTFPPLSSSHTKAPANMEDTSLMTENSILMESFDAPVRRPSVRSIAEEEEEAADHHFNTTNTQEIEKDSLMGTQQSEAIHRRLSIDLEEEDRPLRPSNSFNQLPQQQQQQQSNRSRPETPHDAEAKMYPGMNNASYFAAKRSGGGGSGTGSKVHSPTPSRRPSFKSGTHSPPPANRHMDDDDPFSPSGGRMMDLDSYPSSFVQQDHKDHSLIDVDASQSLTIDFDIAEAKETTNKGSQQQQQQQQQQRNNIPPPKSPYSRMTSNSSNLNNPNLETDYFDSSMGSTQKSSPFNATLQENLHLNADQQEQDDFVLLGTGKYPGKMNFNLSDSFNPPGSNATSSNPPSTDNPKQQSEGNHNNTFSTNDSSMYSDTFENEEDHHHREQERTEGGEEEEDDISYLNASLSQQDLQIQQQQQQRSQQSNAQRQQDFRSGSGSGQFNSTSNSNNNNYPTTPANNSMTSAYSINQSTELSPVFQGLNSNMSHGDLSYSSMYPLGVPGGKKEESPSAPNNNPSSNDLLKWEIGRAPIDLLELANAFEVHISAVRLNSNVSRMIKDFYVSVEFLDIISPNSQSISIRSDSIVQPLSFYTYLTFDEGGKQLLTEEISELRENLSCTVYIYNKSENTLLGQAILELWIMIEDSCNILRQEANIYTPNMTTMIGSVVFDVKGHRLLTSCAT